MRWPLAGSFSAAVVADGPCLCWSPLHASRSSAVGAAPDSYCRGWSTDRPVATSASAGVRASASVIGLPRACQLEASRRSAGLSDSFGCGSKGFGCVNLMFAIPTGLFVSYSPGGASISAQRGPLQGRSLCSSQSVAPSTTRRRATARAACCRVLVCWRSADPRPVQEQRQPARRRWRQRQPARRRWRLWRALPGNSFANP
jgi:hypothetical protein